MELILVGLLFFALSLSSRRTKRPKFLSLETAPLIQTVEAQPNSVRSFYDGRLVLLNIGRDAATSGSKAVLIASQTSTASKPQLIAIANLRPFDFSKVLARQNSEGEWTLHAPLVGPTGQNQPQKKQSVLTLSLRATE